MAEIKYEVVQRIAVLSQRPRGWERQLNLISWNDGEPKYDIRDWSPDGTRMGKGISLSHDEMAILKGLLDDLDYARRLSRDMVNLRGWSLRRVRQGLLQRKLDRETVDEALRQFEDEDETGPIIEIILKKYRDKIFDAGSLRKTIAALQRRGFGYDDIRAALRRIQEEELWEDGSRKQTRNQEKGVAGELGRNSTADGLQ